MARTRNRQGGHVTLRERILKTGGTSLYFDIYIKGDRWTEWLDLRTIGDAKHDRQIRGIAERMRLARETELLADTHDGVATHRSRLRFYEYMLSVADTKRSRGTIDAYRFAAAHALKFFGEDTRLADITPKRLEAFERWLSKGGENGNLSEGSAAVYSACIRATLRKAVDERLLPSHPGRNVKRLRQPSSTSEYLTIEQVRRLHNTSCTNENVKRAFLFACFTGLRISDIRSLTWDEIRGIVQSEGKGMMSQGAAIVKKQQKTGNLVAIPLNADALELLGPILAAGVPVFDLPCSSAITKILKDWKTRAGIRQHVTFHISRHTCTMFLIDANTLLPTVQSILGHKTIRTTMTYFHASSKHLESAMEHLPPLREK